MSDPCTLGRGWRINLPVNTMRYPVGVRRLGKVRQERHASPPWRVSGSPGSFPVLERAPDEGVCT